MQTYECDQLSSQLNSKYIFFHLNDPSKYIKYFPTCTTPSSPRQGSAPCLALAFRFPPAGDNDDDRDHVDNGIDEDDYHDETLMLLKGHLHSFQLYGRS